MKKLNVENEIRSLVDQINAKGPSFRTGTLCRAKADDGKELDGVYDLSFSSETEEIQRWFGIEVLGHRAGEVEMDWLKSGSAPLLLQHDDRTQIGVVESAKIVDRRGTARVRFGKSAKAQEIKADVDDGIRKNVSVGYQTLGMELTRKGKEGEPSVYRVTWKPLEVSIVSVPADTSVGVGRSNEPITPPPENADMKRFQVYHNAPETGSGAAPAPAAPVIDFARAKADARKDELKRIGEINAIADGHRGRLPGVEDLARKAINDGSELGEFRAQILEGYGKMQAPLNQPGNDGLSRQEEKDVSKYSFARALSLLSSGERLDGVEAEMHAEGIKELDGSGKKFSGRCVVIPSRILRFDPRNVSHRSTITTVAGMVPSDIQGGDFISALRARMVCLKAGTRFYGGLQGNIPFPKMTAGAAFGWLAENGSAADASATMGTITGSPKRIGGYVPISNQFLMQAGGVAEQMLREDIAQGVAVAADAGMIAGTGSSNQPTGILYTSGIGSVAGGTNGLAPALTHLVQLETAVGNANGEGPLMHYFTNTKVRGKLKETAKVASTDSRMVWPDNEDVLNGHPALTTNSVPSTLTKGSASGVCSAIGYGDFSQTLIGQWGGLVITVDNLTAVGDNITKFYVNTYFDTIVRRAASFAAMLDALTA